MPSTARLGRLDEDHRIAAESVSGRWGEQLCLVACFLLLYLGRFKRPSNKVGLVLVAPKRRYTLACYYGIPNLDTFIEPDANRAPSGGDATDKTDKSLRIFLHQPFLVGYYN